MSEAIMVTLSIEISRAALTDVVRLTESGLYGKTIERTAEELFRLGLRVALTSEIARHPGARKRKR